MTTINNATNSIPGPFAPAAIAPQRTDGNLYIPPWATDANLAAEDRFTFLQNVSDPTYGAKVTFRKNVNVTAIYSIVAGRMVPAYHFPFAPAATSSVDAASPVTITISRYYRLDSAPAGQHYDQVVPAAAAGMDTLVLVYYRYSAAATATISVTRGQTTVDVEEFAFAGGPDLTRIEHTIALPSPLQTGDVISIRYTSGAGLCGIHGLIAYNSTGVAGPGQQRWIIGTTTTIHAASSSMEFAYRMAPAGGGSTKWIGGYAHQDGTTYGSQVAVSEGFSLDGQAWTLAAGYTAGELVWSRGSTARYDATPTDLGTISEIYEFSGRELFYDSLFTVTAAMNATGERYPAMLPAPKATTYVQVDSRRYDIAGLSDTKYVKLPSPLLPVRMGGGLNGYRLVMAPDDSVPRTRRAAVYCGNGDYNKGYWYLPIGPASLAIGSEFGGGWTYWVERE